MNECKSKFKLYSLIVNIGIIYFIFFNKFNFDSSSVTFPDSIKFAQDTISELKDDSLSYQFDDSLQVFFKTNQDTKRLAPNFYLIDLEGNFHFLNDYCGEKKNSFKKNNKSIVVLSFFASWCIPCRNEYPVLEKIYSTYPKDSVKIFLINVEEEKKAVRDYEEELNIQIPILLDRYGVVTKTFQVFSLPHLFIVDPQQYIIYEQSGFVSPESLFVLVSFQIDSLLRNNLNF